LLSIEKLRYSILILSLSLIEYTKKKRYKYYRLALEFNIISINNSIISLKEKKIEEEYAAESIAIY